jgi:hypothetical protein
MKDHCVNTHHNCRAIKYAAMNDEAIRDGWAFINGCPWKDPFAPYSEAVRERIANKD